MDQLRVLQRNVKSERSASPVSPAVRLSKRRARAGCLVILGRPLCPRPCMCKGHRGDHELSCWQSRALYRVVGSSGDPGLPAGELASPPGIQPQAVDQAAHVGRTDEAPRRNCMPIEGSNVSPALPVTEPCQKLLERSLFRPLDLPVEPIRPTPQRERTGPG